VRGNGSHLCAARRPSTTGLRISAGDTPGFFAMIVDPFQLRRFRVSFGAFPPSWLTGFTGFRMKPGESNPVDPVNPVENAQCHFAAHTPNPQLPVKRRACVVNSRFDCQQGCKPQPCFGRWIVGTLPSTSPQPSPPRRGRNSAAIEYKCPDEMPSGCLVLRAKTKPVSMGRFHKAITRRKISIDAGVAVALHWGA
jgi:hypothetical protein